jgi:hypothetical protein
MSISKPHLSSKHLIIKKANATIFAAIAIAVFMVIFGLFATRALLDQASYHQRVISAKKDALNKAEDNSDKVKDLEASYRSFASESVNVLGGNPTGNGALDGSNPKIVLDALPSVYDYPALSSSVEKILTDNSYQIERIGGSEDKALSSSNTSGNSPVSTSSPVELPYPLTIQSTVSGVENLLNIFERSIRPFYIEKIQLSGSDQSLSAKFTMKTFYQPGISFQVSTEVIE